MQNVKVVVLTIIFFIVSAATALSYDLEDYFPLSVGNSWNYLIKEGENVSQKTMKIESEETIEGVETTKITSLEGENDYAYITTDSKGIKILKSYDKNEDENTIFNPPKLFLPKNIEVGDTIEDSTASVVYLKNEEIKETEQENIKITLESIEDVEVAAGKFSNCLKLLITSNWKEGIGDYGTDSSTLWLAEGVGIVKKFCTDSWYVAESNANETTIEEQELTSAFVK